MNIKEEKLINYFLGLPRGAKVSESNLLKIKSVLTLYSICAYISNILLIGLLILGVQMGLNVLYLLVLLFTVNLLFPIPFLFYIKNKGYGKIENAGELTAKVPVFLLFVSTVLYYLGSLLIAGKVEQLFDGKSVLVAAFWGLFMAWFFHIHEASEIRKNTK
ncbi:MAG: hypothetical protein ACI31W_06330 [Lactococcus sp.]